MNTNQAVVLTSDDFLAQTPQRRSDWPMAVHAWPQTMEEGSQLMGRLVDDGCRYMLILGGDDLVSQVITAYCRRSDLAAQGLCFWPLAVEEGLVARACRSSTPIHKVPQVVGEGVDRWRRHQLATLKVTASTEAAGWYGFSFATGWAYRVFEARQRAKGGASNLLGAYGKLATNTLRDDEGGPVALRVTVDHRPSDRRTGSMVISTLEKSYFGLGVAGQGPMVWEGLAAATLVRKAMTPELLESSHRQGRPFEVVHLDTPKGWLLDGRLHRSDRPGIVQIAPGPTVTFISPHRGLRGRVRHLLSR